MTHVKLITETVEDVELLVEGTDKKEYYIEGIFMSADIKNRNGRLYPRSVMEGALGKYKSLVESNRAMGELNHPEGPSVNLDKVSHLITKLQFEGNHVMGKAKILDTPMGNIARKLLEGGVKLGVSSRGLGSLKEVNGANEVQSDFILTAIDIVGDPSAPDAFVNGIMEGKEWVWDNGILKEAKIEEMKQEILTASRSEIEATAVKQFEAFLAGLKSKVL